MDYEVLERTDYDVGDRFKSSAYPSDYYGIITKITSEKVYFSWGGSTSNRSNAGNNYKYSIKEFNNRVKDEIFYLEFL